MTGWQRGSFLFGKASLIKYYSTLKRRRQSNLSSRLEKCKSGCALCFRAKAVHLNKKVAIVADPYKALKSMVNVYKYITTIFSHAQENITSS